MRAKREKLSVSLPPGHARALRRLAAEMHAPVSGLVALAVERFLANISALWGVAELLEPDDPRAAARRLVAEAREQLKRMGVRRRDGEAPGAGEGADSKADTQVAAPAERRQA